MSKKKKLVALVKITCPKNLEHNITFTTPIKINKRNKITIDFDQKLMCNTCQMDITYAIEYPENE